MSKGRTVYGAPGCDHLTTNAAKAEDWRRAGYPVRQGVWYPLDADPAELVGVLAGLIEEARDEICADWEVDDLLRHALDRIRRWQKGGRNAD